jgi:tetratricopeptide (TPR) repeat protein
MKFLFFFEREMHIPVLKNVIKYINENDLGEIGVTGFAYTESAPDIPGRGFRREVLDFHCPYDLKIYPNPLEFQPDVTFTADFSYHYLEGLGKIINIGHGTISKGWFFSKNRISLRENCADVICVPGEVHKEFLAENVKIPIEVTGMPKLDALFSSEKTQAEILLELGLNPENKTVLIAPTFNQELSLIPYLGFDIDKYIPSYLNVIIKLHGVAPEEWRRNYQNIANSKSNVAYVENSDISDCFIAADLMVSDVSSVIFEFAALEKPILLFDSPDQKLYQNHDENSIEYIYRNVGKTFNDFAKLPELLFKAFMEPLAQEAKDIGRKFIGIRDDSSAKKVVEVAIKALEQNSNKDVVLLDLDNAEIQEQLRKRYEGKFEVIKANSENLLKDLKNAAEMSETIHYIGEVNNLTPFYPVWMRNHLGNENAICFPLACDKNIPLQDNLSFHVKFGSEMSDLTKAIQMTYGMCGEESEIDYLKRKTFSIRSEIIRELDSEETDENLIWFDIFKYIYRKNLKAVIAKDCYLYPVVNNILDYDCLILGWEDSQITRHKTQKLSSSKLFNSIEENSNQDTNSFTETKVESSWNMLANTVEPDHREDDIRQRIEEDPFNQNNILDLVRFYYENENYDMVDVYADMLTDCPEAELLTAYAFEKQNMVEDALERISGINTLSILDKDLLADVLIEKGKLLIKNQRHMEAIPLLEEAIAVSPSKVASYINLGSAFLINNEISKAHHVFEQGRQIENDNVSVLNGLGIIKQNQGFYQEASELYLQILGIDPENLNAIQGLLGCVYQTRHFVKIIPYLENYRLRHPENQEMSFVLAGVYFEAGDLQDALTCINSILTFNPDFQGAEELKSRILAKI